jgi:hypothetical protein
VVRFERMIVHAHEAGGHAVETKGRRANAMSRIALDAEEHVYG